MTIDLDARIAELRQRRRAEEDDAAGELDRLKQGLAEHADGIGRKLDAEGKQIRLMMFSVSGHVAAEQARLEALRADNEELRTRLDANGIVLRRQVKGAWAALGGICLVAAGILLLAVWGASRLVDGAKQEADTIRAANAGELAAAQEDGARALATLEAQLAAQRASVEQSLGAAGAELAGLEAERASVKAELEQFVTLRDRIGIQLVESHTRPVIVVPEGYELRGWRAAGLSDLARYNGRMYRVMARK